MYSIMKAKRGVFLLLVLVTVLFSTMHGCKPNGEGGSGNGGSGSQTPEERWKTWLNLKEQLGHEVLGVGESRRWLEEHRSRISVPAEIGFLERHLVRELPYVAHGVIITADHHGNSRVVAWSWPDPWPPDGFMNEAESLAWLKAQGYQVKKDDDGYTLTKMIESHSHGINIEHSQVTKIGRGATLVMSNATIKTDWVGGLVVKVH